MNLQTTQTGPLHDAIGPPGPRDNVTVYYADATPALYEELFFGMGPEAGIVVQHPNLGTVDLRGDRDHARREMPERLSERRRSQVAACSHRPKTYANPPWGAPVAVLLTGTPVRPAPDRPAQAALRSPAASLAGPMSVFAPRRADVCASRKDMVDLRK